MSGWRYARPARVRVRNGDELARERIVCGDGLHVKLAERYMVTQGPGRALAHAKRPPWRRGEVRAFFDAARAADASAADASAVSGEERGERGGSRHAVSVRAKPTCGYTGTWRDARYREERRLYGGGRVAPLLPGSGPLGLDPTRPPDPLPGPRTSRLTSNAARQRRAATVTSPLRSRVSAHLVDHWIGGGSAADAGTLENLAKGARARAVPPHLRCSGAPGEGLAEGSFAEGPSAAAVRAAEPGPEAKSAVAGERNRGPSAAERATRGLAAAWRRTIRASASGARARAQRVGEAKREAAAAQREARRARARPQRRRRGQTPEAWRAQQTEASRRRWAESMAHAAEEGGLRGQRRLLHQMDEATSLIRRWREAGGAMARLEGRGPGARPGAVRGPERCGGRTDGNKRKGARFAGRDTASQVVLGTERGSGGAAPVRVRQPYDAVYGPQHEGRDTRSSMKGILC
jgi:hypothetical protein